jgi:hypothetical protein
MFLRPKGGVTRHFGYGAYDCQKAAVCELAHNANASNPVYPHGMDDLIWHLKVERQANGPPFDFDDIYFPM